MDVGGCNTAELYCKNATAIYNELTNKRKAPIKEVRIMKTNRVEEIISNMTSFGKDRYHRSELLSEMFKLQEDTVRLTFNEEHASTADLKIWDVERHLTDLNEQNNHIADVELEKFKGECRTLCNLIKAEISGQRGENRAFRSLEFLNAPSLIVKNVELSDGDLRTEIDALVINPNGLVIVEVKNTSKDIFIDERGDYFRTGEFLKWDCNIADKMAVKETLLKKALAAVGIDVPSIHKIVVFTDNRIQVQNKCNMIETCFVSQLSYKIDDLRNECNCSIQLMNDIKEAVEQASSKEEYPFEFDVKGFKHDFAVVMSILESASSDADIEEETEIIEFHIPENKEETVVKDNKVEMFETRKPRRFGNVAAIALVALAAGITAFNTIGKGGI